MPSNLRSGLRVNTHNYRPSRCHTSCQEPRNAVCDVKCEKPECEIKCPDKACEAEDCPKCVTICK